MNCDEFEERLHQDSLSEQELEEMDKHTVVCSSCLLKSDLKSLMPHEEIPESAASAWRQAVLKEAGSKKVRKYPAWARVASIAASLVILTAGALRVGRLNLSTPAAVQAPSAPANDDRTVSSTVAKMLKGVAQRNDGAAGAVYEEEALEEAAEAPMMAASYDMGAANAPAEEVEMELDEAEELVTVSGAAAVSDGNAERIVRNAYIEIVTANFDDDLLLTQAAVTDQGGQLSSSNTSQNRSRTRNAFLTARIPAEHLDRFLETLESISGRITQKDVSAENMTEQYKDLRGRLDNATVQRDRLRELLDQAENVSDLMQIERSLTEAQSTVEALTGQINHLDQRVSFSTVSISLNEETPAQSVRQTDGGFLNRLKNGMDLSLRAFGHFFQNLCLFLVMALPWAAVPAVILFMIHLILKTRKEKNP